MTAEHLAILQHALGTDQYGRGEYRNHFCAGGRDLVLCRELVRLGYMTERPGSEITGGDPLFRVTKDGMDAVRRESSVAGSNGATH